MAANSPNTCVQLPVEVIELIIDELASCDDKLMLRSFALVAHGFVVKCQKHLLHTVNLGDKRITGEKYYRLFSRCIHKYPHLRAYVRDLRLVDTYVWDPKKDWKWLVKDETLCDVLGCLPNLEHFSLAFHTHQPSWFLFNSCLRNALIRICRRTSLKSLSLSSIHDMPPSVFALLLSVKDLRLCDVQTHPFSLFTPSNITPQADCGAPSVENLTSLTLGSISSTTMQILRSALHYPQTPSSLRTLRVILLDQSQPDLIEHLWAVMQWASKSLVRLEWRTLMMKTSVAHRPPYPIDLQELTSLQILRFPVNFHCTEGPVFSEFIQMLDQLALSCPLRELIVESMFVNAMELIARAADWSQLDATLSNPKFRSLDKVTFGGRWRALPPSVKVSAKAILLEQLPASRANGLRIFFDTEL